jgi:hypothetical protein
MKMLKSRPLAAVRAEAARAPADAGRQPRLALVAGAQSPGESQAPPAGHGAATAPAAALQQGHSFLALLAESMARATQNAGASAAVLPLLVRPHTGAELLELQSAVLERLQQLQQAWWQGWTGWLDEFGQLRRADTLSEHLEQQYNLGAQFGALLQSQASDLVDLQDTVQVDYGYWVARKLRDSSGDGR